MRYEPFHDFKLSQLGLGCASAWGQAWFDEHMAISIVHHAIELGITVFDTGASYSNGNAEPRLGKALKGKSIDNLFISTKTGTHIAPNGTLYKDWSKKAIIQQIEKSRQHLGIDTIPLVYLHGPCKSELKNQLFDTLNEIRHKKWVRFFGVNSFDNEGLNILPDISEIDVVMPDYNFMRIDREPLIKKLHASGKVIIGGAVLANQVHAPQFLWPKNRVDLWYLLRALKNHRHAYLRARKLKFLQNVPDWTPADIAIAFAALNSHIATSMFSTTRIQHLEDNVRASYKILPNNITQAIYAAFNA